MEFDIAALGGRRRAGSLRTRGSELARAVLTVHGSRVNMKMASAYVRRGVENAKKKEEERRVKQGQREDEGKEEWTRVMINAYARASVS